ncbi:hypothetical protein [Bradyrhizobium sp. 191]|uniref:hypothetical protein n=1 Tax=Bradyrhizobium sp. 191 TaxID=2782659 RepID=UPI001FFF2056|nr:hypothetical protein [Bradyrhizobium sp. 191]UPJ68101.1 hypothetical protein IVB23_12380 [Bradyrhizobium sp. 191]
MMMSDCAALVTHFRAVRPGSFGNAAERTARAMIQDRSPKQETRVRDVLQSGEMIGHGSCRQKI